MIDNRSDLPTRCIDPVIKFCQECRYGYCNYPEWVESAADIPGCVFESGCTLGFDKSRPEDEPTEEELKEFEDWVKGEKNGNDKQSRI